MHQPLAVLLQHGQLHREMKPVQNMRGLWAHLKLKRTKRVVAIRQKGNVLVHLQALRVQHLIQASFRLRIQCLHIAPSGRTFQSGDSPELAQGLPYKGKSMRNRGVSSPMPFLLIPRSLLRGGFIDDLLASPFDIELETFALEVKNLIIPIMEAVQKYGLKRYYLNKFKQNIDSFYKRVITDMRYTSDLTNTYQKLFVRYQDSLFTFIDQDGIPWHNNTAERAIRYISKQRAISTNFHASVMKDYLILLGIRQACRFQGKSFLKFLFSGETDLEKFE